MLKKTGIVCLLAAVATVLAAPAYAATFTATRMRLDTADANPGDGICADSSGACSIRAAVGEANASPGRDLIRLTGDIHDTTAAAVLNEILITESVEIVGDGIDKTKIAGVHLQRLFRIAPDVEVVISDLTLSAGYSEDGGLIKNEGTLTLQRTVLSSGYAKRGGAVFSTGALTAIDTYFDSNIGLSPGAFGAGIYNAGLLVLDRVAVAGGRTGRGCGGGLYNDAAGIAEIINSTIAKNGSLRGSGGAICNQGGTVRCTNCSIVRNRASDGGGGIFNSGGSVQLVNTMLSDNTNSGDPSDCGGDPVVSLGHNLESGNTCGLTSAGDQSEVDPGLRSLQVSFDGYTPIVPLKGITSPIVDAGDDTFCPSVDQRGWPRPYGAACDIGAAEIQPTVPTPSMSYTPGSPTATRTPLNTRTPTTEPTITPTEPPPGSPTTTFTPTETFTRTPTATKKETKTPAPTRTPTASATPFPDGAFTVDMKADDAPDALPGDGICASARGFCTIRAAIDEANVSATPRIIHLLNGSAKLNGDLVVERDVTLVGSDMYDTVIDASNNGRALHIVHGASIFVSDMTLNDGTADQGGVILNEGTLIMERCRLRGGHAKQGAGLMNLGSASLTDVYFDGHVDSPPSGLGGCIHNRGTLLLNRVSLKRGQARLGCGGGIYNAQTGIIQATNLTVMRNRARLAMAGGICNDRGQIRCTNCTIARNQGNNTAGGILNVQGHIELLNTIVADNFHSGYGRGANCAGDPIISLGHNLDSGNTCNFTGTGDQSNADPRVRVLGFVGGGRIPVGAFKSSDSPAVDAGDTAGCPPVDALDHPRPVGAGCDIGAYEEPQ